MENKGRVKKVSNINVDEYWQQTGKLTAGGNT
jgi:hypothetical protein